MGGQRRSTGFVVLGSNGEAALMDDFESDQVIVAAREVVPRDRPFIVGTGRESTQAAIKARRSARPSTAPTPCWCARPGSSRAQMTNDVFVRHYTAVADASPVPVLLYNFTAVTGVNLLPGRGRAARDASEHRRHEGIGRRRRADRGSGRRRRRTTSACSPARRRRSIRRCASARPAASSRSPARCPTPCVRLFELTRGGPARRGARAAAASWCRSRGCSARRTACRA